MLEGSGYGDNARAALIAGPWWKMRKLAIAMGAQEETLYGLTGWAIWWLPRVPIIPQFQAGVKLAQGKNLEETINSIPMVVEGFRTCLAAYEAARD